MCCISRFKIKCTLKFVNNNKMTCHPGKIYSRLVFMSLQLHYNLGHKISAIVATGNGPAYTTGRISYTFGLQGPCISTDTACSSSLVATHLAHKGILAGDTITGLAGGINTMLLPITSCTISTLGALSPNARCKTFDASADG